MSRTQPMSTEISPSGSSVPTMNSVEPPPTSTTRYGSGSVEAGGRADELERAPLRRRESSSGRTPSSCSAGIEELVAVASRRATRSVAVIADALDAELVDRAAVLAQHGDGALDRVGMRARASRARLGRGA